MILLNQDIYICNIYEGSRTVAEKGKVKLHVGKSYVQKRGITVRGLALQCTYFIETARSEEQVRIILQLHFAEVAITVGQ